MATQRLVSSAMDASSLRRKRRFRRVKHWAGLTQSIAYCSDEALARLLDVDYVAINRNPRVNNLRRISCVLRNRLDPRLVQNRFRNIR